MEKKYGLTYTELELMEYFWSQDKAVTFKEVMEYANNDLGKGWKKQTLGTYLKNLQLAGLLRVDDSKKNYNYYPARTKEEHIEQWVKQLVEKSFGNSIGKFVAAFSGGKKLSQEDAEELKKLI